MEDPVIVSSQDKLIEQLHFKPYRSVVERRVFSFLPAPDEPQTMDIKTPWGAELTATYGDFLISELHAPGDYWPVDPKIFEDSYMIIRPGYCVKRALTYLVPLTEVTGGDPDRLVTVVSLEGPETVRAGDFYLAKGIKGEVWAYPKEKVDDVMTPSE